MRAPIAFVYGNCVFGEGLTDGWAAFAVSLDSYQWLAADEKRSRFLALVGALESAEADIQILRVSSRWNHDALPADASRSPGLRADAHERYVSGQLAALRGRDATGLTALHPREPS
jgi:hypothetical protein